MKKLSDESLEKVMGGQNNSGTLEYIMKIMSEQGMQIETINSYGMAGKNVPGGNTSVFKPGN